MSLSEPDNSAAVVLAADRLAREVAGRLVLLLTGGKEHETMAAPTDEVVLVEFGSRIPKALHRALKLHCVTTQTSVMDFVTTAIQEKLARSSGAPAKRRATKV